MNKLLMELTINHKNFLPHLSDKVIHHMGIDSEDSQMIEEILDELDELDELDIRVGVYINYLHTLHSFQLLADFL